MERSEKSMRDETAPTPKSVEELTTYVDSLICGDHDYGTCVYAMSLAATAAFNLVASKLGVTGFQASCADLDVLRRTRRLEGPFMLIDTADALYPQYDLPGRLAEHLASDATRQWLADRARERLAALTDETPASQRVVAHWQTLADAMPSKVEG